jgi:filamentous hemagglutinin family protein
MTFAPSVLASPRRSAGLRRAALLARTALGTALFVFPAASAFAGPDGEAVRAGQATVTRPDTSTTVITQMSNRALIDWRSFSLTATETAQFVQPGASSLTVNRVTGGQASQLMGSLKANGTVAIINPAGVIIGAGATINVGGLVASAHRLADADVDEAMNSGRLRLSQPDGGAGDVVNEGTITASEAGIVALTGGSVANRGVITATLGQVSLAAGEVATVDLAGDGLVSFAASQPAGKGRSGPLVDQAGTVDAAGGTVRLSVAQAAKIVGQSISMTGVTRASSARQGPGGSVVLDGGQGEVSVRGRLEANAAAGKGGRVQVTGRKVKLAGATVEAKGTEGGGTVRIGGGWQGGEGLAAAQETSVDATTRIDVSATQNGNGGTAVVWADGLTDYRGLVLARGGDQGGDGGQVEVSGKAVLAFDGYVDTRAPKGNGGSLLLDPYNLEIVSGASSGVSTASSPFVATANDSKLNVTTLTNLLATTNVTVSTGTSGTQDGNITVSTAVTWSSNNTLTLTAAKNITIGASGSIRNTIGSGGVTLNAVSGVITVGGVIEASGNIQLLSPRVIIAADIKQGGTGRLTIGNAGATYSLVGSARITFEGNSTLRIAGDDYNLIRTAQELQDIKKSNMNGSYALAADIKWNLGDFSPIGSGYFLNPFKGNFDGLNRSIYDLRIANYNTSFNAGLFGNTERATIRNVGLVNVVIDIGDGSGSALGTGAVIGYMRGGILENVYATRSVKGGQGSVGGLVGAAYAFKNDAGTIVETAKIKRSYTNINVIGATSGGLVGKASGADISQAFAMGSVKGSVAGGLVGSTATEVGGVTTLAETFAVGQVSGSTSAGGLIGLVNTPTSVTAANSWWATDTTGQLNGAGGSTSIAGVTGITFDQLTGGKTLAALGFTSEGWARRDGVSLPYLTWRFGTAGPSVINGFVQDSSGKGLAGATVSAVTQGGTSLANLTTMANGRFFDMVDTSTMPAEGTLVRYDAPGTTATGGLAVARSNANRDLRTVLVRPSTVSVGTGGADETPRAILAAVASARLWNYSNFYSVTNKVAIGLNTAVTGYNVDGTDYTVIRTAAALDAIRNNLGKSYVLGQGIDLSGYTNWGSIGTDGSEFTGTFDGLGNTITGLTISAGTQDNVGLFGATDGATLRSVILANVNVAGSAYTGGLVGYMYRGSITEASVSGLVSGSSWVGGLAGYVGYSKVTGSFSTAGVSGSGEVVGGLIGYLASAEVSSAYSTGSVSGGFAVGGLIGFSNSSTLNQTYATGHVHDAAGGWAGGLVGDTSGAMTANFSWWATDTTGQQSSAGGTGVTFAQLTGANPNALTSLGFDTGVWGRRDGVSLPYLTWRFPDGPAVVTGSATAGNDFAKGATVGLIANGVRSDGTASVGATGSYMLMTDAIPNGVAALVTMSGTYFAGASDTPTVATGNRAFYLPSNMATVRVAGAPGLVAGAVSVDGLASMSAVRTLLAAAVGTVAGDDVLYTTPIGSGQPAVSVSGTGTRLLLANASGFNVDAGATAQGDIEVTTTGGNITVSSAISTAGGLKLNSAGNIVVETSKTITAGGDVRLSATGDEKDITIGGGINASGSIQIIATRNVALNAAVGSTKANTADAVLIVAGSNDAAGTATGGNITAGTGAAINVVASSGARLYTGSINGSTGVGTMAGSWGPKSFRYNGVQTTSYSGYGALSATAKYVIYRQQPTLALANAGQSRTYDSTITTQLSATVANSGDLTAGFSRTAAGGGTAETATEAKNAGTYSIDTTTADNAKALGYIVDARAYVIDKRQFTVTSGATATKTYDGTTAATLAMNAATFTDVNGNTFTDSVLISAMTGTGTFSSANAGPRSVAGLTFVLANNSSASGNYEFVTTPQQQTTATGTINKAQLTVSNITASNKTYDGTTTATLGLANATYAGLVSSDVGKVTVSVTATGTFNSPDVGTGKTVTITGLTLVNDGGGNYELATAGQQGEAYADITAQPSTPPSQTPPTQTPADQAPAAEAPATPELDLDKVIKTPLAIADNAQGSTSGGAVWGTTEMSALASPFTGQLYFILARNEPQTVRRDGSRQRAGLETQQTGEGSLDGRDDEKERRRRQQRQAAPAAN